MSTNFVTILLSSGRNGVAFHDPLTPNVVWTQNKLKQFLKTHDSKIKFASNANQKTVDFIVFPNGNEDAFRKSKNSRTQVVSLKQFLQIRGIKKTKQTIHPLTILCEKRKWILEKTREHKAEVSGNVSLTGKFVYYGPNPDPSHPFMVEPEKEKCLGTWHSHPPLSVLETKDEKVDIFFNPPSLGDIYYAIVGNLLNLYPLSFIVSWEGTYQISVQSKGLKLAEQELKDLLSSEDPFLMPAEPLFYDNGAHKGFDFHGQESFYPYLSVLFSIESSLWWKHETLEEAITNLQKVLKPYFIEIAFFSDHVSETSPEGICKNI